MSLTTFLQKKHGLTPMAAAKLAEKIMRDKAERAKEKKLKLEKAQLTMDLGDGAGEVATHPSDEVDPTVNF